MTHRSLAVGLMLVSAGIPLTLGLIHLVHTFRGAKLQPRDPELLHRMRETAPVISRQTTMWRAWIGFNASHSLGALLFGLIYGYLAMGHPDALFGSPFLLLIGLLALGGWCALAKLYWFRIPLAAIALALIAYVSGVAVARF